MTYKGIIMMKHGSIETINQKLLERHIAVLGDYTGSRYIASFRCLIDTCHCEWQMIAHSVLYNEAGCPDCWSRKKEEQSGPNASLDHIIPMSKGGSVEIDNLQWIVWWANNMKSDHITDQFVEYCRIIVEFHDAKKGKKAA
jgi:hypothetical protein